MKTNICHQLAKWRNNKNSTVSLEIEALRFLRGFVSAGVFPSAEALQNFGFGERGALVGDSERI